LVDSDLLSKGTFPIDDALGLIATKNMNLAGPGLPHLKIMGAFYAEGTITAQQQISIAGALVSNRIDAGTTNSSIYHVPALATNLSSGLLGGEPVWVVKVLTWREISD